TSLLAAGRGVGRELRHVLLDADRAVGKRAQLRGEPRVSRSTTLQTGRGLANLLHGGDKEPDQHRDDRDDDEELDEREPRSTAEREPCSHGVPHFVRRRSAEGTRGDGGVLVTAPRRHKAKTLALRQSRAAVVPVTGVRRRRYPLTARRSTAP